MLIILTIIAWKRGWSPKSLLIPGGFLLLVISLVILTFLLETLMLPNFIVKKIFSGTLGLGWFFCLVILIYMCIKPPWDAPKLNQILKVKIEPEEKSKFKKKVPIIYTLIPKTEKSKNWIKENLSEMYYNTTENAFNVNRIYLDKIYKLLHEAKMRKEIIIIKNKKETKKHRSK